MRHETSTAPPMEISQEATKTVIVLGQARSGTSMTAGLLSLIGVNLVSYVDNPSDQNPRGGFENKEFNSLTAKMYLALQDGKSKEEVEEEFKPKIEELICGNTGLWGWKSALTHYSLDILLPYTVNPHLVYVFRNPFHCGQSLIIHKKRYGRHLSEIEALQEVLAAYIILGNTLERYQDVPHAVVTYESLRSSPFDEVSKLGNLLGIDITPFQSQIEEFVMPEYSTLKNPS